MNDPKNNPINISIEIVDETGNFTVVSRPRSDKRWHSALEGTEHAQEGSTTIVGGAFYELFIDQLPENTIANKPPIPFRGFINRQFIDNTLIFQPLKVAPNIWDKAFPFQREDIELAVRMGGRCFLSGEMGVGKTMESLGVVSYFRTDTSRHLFIVPSYLRGNWWREIDFWTGEDSQVVYKTKDELSNKPFIIISYDLAVRKFKDINKIKWETIVCDESHYLKSRSAKRVKTLSRMVSNAPHTLLLSGTPALSRPAELYTQLRILFPVYFKQFSQFAFRYCDLHKTHWGYDSNGATHCNEMATIMKKCMVRRLKKDVLSDLPKKIRKEVHVELTCKEKKELDEHFKELEKLNAILNKVQVANKRTRDMAFQRQSLISEMFRATARAKQRAVYDYVCGVVQDNQQKIIIFGYHMITLDAIQNLAVKLKEPFIRIDGSTPQQDRQGLVDAFQDPKGPRLAILSIGACNSGLTLTACHYTIFAELTWTPSLLLQCEDRYVPFILFFSVQILTPCFFVYRTHRIGQDETCHYDYIIAKDSLDERVMKKIKNKHSLLDHIIDSKGNTNAFDINEEVEVACEEDEYIQGELISDGDGGGSDSKGNNCNQGSERKRRRNNVC